MTKFDMKIFDGTQKLEFLGTGYPMYFNFFKFCGILLITLFLCEGLTAMLTNQKGGFCYEDLLSYRESQLHHDGEHVDTSHDTDSTTDETHADDSHAEEDQGDTDDHHRILSSDSGDTKEPIKKGKEAPSYFCIKDFLSEHSLANI